MLHNAPSTLSGISTIFLQRAGVDTLGFAVRIVSAAAFQLCLHSVEEAIIANAYLNTWLCAYKTLFVISREVLVCELQFAGFSSLWKVLSSN